MLKKVLIANRVEIALRAVSGLLPLIMLAIWRESSNFGEFNNISLTHYFISAFIVRQFTAVWVMVTFEEDYIQGKLSPFLLQPISPFWRYILNSSILGVSSTFLTLLIAII